jgi:hypothetical protein
MMKQCNYPQILVHLDSGGYPTTTAEEQEIIGKRLGIRLGPVTKSRTAKCLERVA